MTRTRGAPTGLDAFHFAANVVDNYHRLGWKPKHFPLSVLVVHQPRGYDPHAPNSWHNELTGLITLNLESVTSNANMYCVLAHETFHDVQLNYMPAEGVAAQRRRWWNEITADYATLLTTELYGSGHQRAPETYFQYPLTNTDPIGDERHPEIFGHEFVKHMEKLG